MKKKSNMLLEVKGRLRKWCKRGQATIEYLMMLCTVVVLFSAAFVTFHTRIARWFFTLIGVILDQRPTSNL